MESMVSLPLGLLVQRLKVKTLLENQGALLAKSAIIFMSGYIRRSQNLKQDGARFLFFCLISLSLSLCPSTYHFLTNDCIIVYCAYDLKFWVFCFHRIAKTFIRQKMEMVGLNNLLNHSFLDYCRRYIPTLPPFYVQGASSEFIVC